MNMLKHEKYALNPPKLLDPVYISFFVCFEIYKYMDAPSWSL
jgi:hypothetical protein